MKHLTAADLAALRRQLSPDAMARIVANIAAHWRASIGVPAAWTDDDVIWALYHPAGQTPRERAGLRVVRACIAYREASQDGRDGWLDMLALALAEADPVRVAGVAVAAGRSTAGSKTAARRKTEAAGRDVRILRAARALLEANPAMTFKDLARRLEERNLGTFATLTKKLPRLLPAKKKSESR